MAGNSSSEALVFEADAQVMALTAVGWDAFLERKGSTGAAGQAIFKDIFQSEPMMKELFKKDISVRFMMGVKLLLEAHENRAELGLRAEKLALQHVSVAMSRFHVDVFKLSIVRVVQAELGDAMPAPFSEGIGALLVFMGSVCRSTRQLYKNRFDILSSSWKIVKGGHALDETQVRAMLEDENGEQDSESPASVARPEETNKRGKEAAAPTNEANMSHEARTNRMRLSDIQVPRTYNEMFRFNASVMGFEGKAWMDDVLESFDDMVTNAASPTRLQEECKVLALCLGLQRGGVALKEYRSVMLSCLRALLPKQWNSDYETAWTWLWDTIEKQITQLKGKPRVFSNSLQLFFGRMGEEREMSLSLEIFEGFFSKCAEASEFLNVSNARLLYIFGRIRGIAQEIFRDPRGAVMDLSGLGLKHAGFGVRENLILIFVDICLQAMSNYSSDPKVHEALRWTFDLVTQILSRSVLEGSTAVMQAVTANSGKLLRQAVADSSRGSRAKLLTNVQVGVVTISPVAWAIETRALKAAEAMLTDLLTIRADRANYYYGMDVLFDRHPDILHMLCTSAPSLLKPFLDGLVWRSTKVVDRQRRVNYYLRHLLVDKDNRFSQSLPALVSHGDPEIIIHPLSQFCLDLLWTRLGASTFFFTKLWFMFTLVIYCIGLQYGILMFDSQGPGRWALISCRIFVYTLSLGQLLVKHSYSVVKAVRKKNITMARGCIPLPTYLLNSNQETYEFVLLLFLICQVSIEPFLHCLQVDDSWYTNCCYADAKWCELSDGYDRLTVAPQIIYFFLFAEIAHMSLKFSSFYIVCMQILNDLQLYFVALIWWTATVAAGIACLPQCLKGTQARDFYNWSSSFQSLLAIGLNAYGDSQGIAESPETLLLWCVFLFAFGWHVFFLNVLIAQFCKSFNIASEHAFGKAYLVRAQNIFGTVMPLISTKRWLRFVASLKLDEPCELDEGDLGPSGAVKAVEPADANAALAGKNIRRFGGLTSASLPWTAERAFEEDEDTAVERLQKLMSARFNEVERMMKALTEQSARELNSQLRLSTASEGLGSDMLQPQLSVPEEFGQLFDSREESEDQHLPEITRDVFV